MPTKVCPLCSTVVSLRRVSCDCGYTLVFKCKSFSINSTKFESRTKRLHEAVSETLNHRKGDTELKARKRAFETDEETLRRNRTNKIATAKKKRFRN